MQYLQCSSQWLLGKQDYKFVTMSGKVNPCEIDVPEFFWEYGQDSEHRVGVGFANENGKLVNRYSVLRPVKCISLNGLEVNFTAGFKYANILLFDRIKQANVAITLDVVPNVVSLNAKNGRQMRRLSGISYNMDASGDVQSYYQQYTSKGAPAASFTGVAGLAKAEDTFNGQYKFCYGLPHTPFAVKYKGKELNGKCYALICGSWGILLDDDMSFDALVCFNMVKGQQSLILGISKFLYVTNTYLIKVMTLTK